MTAIAIFSGSPMAQSRSALLGRHVGSVLTGRGLAAQWFNIRDLPAQDLLFGRADSPALRPALAAVEMAQGVVVCSPVYKASYTGVMKLFLDLLPQAGLSGKVILPLLTGGTLAHMLVIDYALRPVLISLGASHISTGLFVLDKHLGRMETGELMVEADLGQRIENVLDDFAQHLRRAQLSPTDEGSSAKREQ